MTTDELVDELALMLANARTHGNVYMDCSHNPLPSEYQEARRFIDDLVCGGETRHLIRFRDDGWMVQHPISERFDGSLFDCDFVWDGSEYPEGTYVLYMDDLGNMNIGNRL